MTVNLSPSQYWDGNDGPWSSFALQLGNPPQTIRVFPSTSGSSIWAVLKEGCVAGQDPSDCNVSRGLLFEPDKSSTFARVGTSYFQLPFEAEASLGYSGNSEVGFDTVILGWQGSSSPDLERQVITGFATKVIDLGLLGLTPRPVNITDFTDEHSSPLGTLLRTEQVSSSYWAYTAGAQYRQPEVYGSLTFGGFDSLRGDFSTATGIPFGPNTDRDLLVSLSQIIVDDGATTQVDGLPIYVFIDSTVPSIYLPLEACRSFEIVFGLQWNDTAGMYLVSDTQHSKMVVQNASVTFVFSASGQNSMETTTKITMPYSSFDLEASYPLAGMVGSNKTKYFPLMRAENSSQYTLGRTFFQEAYVAADYDRSLFYLTQAQFPPNSASVRIIAIDPPGLRKRLSTAAMAGIVVGALVVLAVVAGLIIHRLLRKRHMRKKQELAGAVSAADEELQKAHEMRQQITKQELDAVGPAVGPHKHREELDVQRPDLSSVEIGGEAIHEMLSEDRRVELPLNNGSSPVELP